MVGSYSPTGLMRAVLVRSTLQGLIESIHRQSLSDMSTLVTASQRSVVSMKIGYTHSDEHVKYPLLLHYVCSRFGYANIRLC